MFTDIDSLQISEDEKRLLKRSMTRSSLSIQEYSDVIDIKNKVKKLLTLNQ